MEAKTKPVPENWTLTEEQREQCKKSLDFIRNAPNDARWELDFDTIDENGNDVDGEKTRYTMDKDGMLAVMEALYNNETKIPFNFIKEETINE